MKDSALEFLVITLSKIEAIAAELPRIGKQSELKVKADEIMKLTETPNLGQMFGGVMIGRLTISTLLASITRSGGFSFACSSKAVPQSNSKPANPAITLYGATAAVVAGKPSGNRTWDEGK